MTISAKTGYAESKHISERLCSTAVSIGSASASVCHIGQTALPVGYRGVGVWAQDEWLPSIVASSNTLGVILDHLGGLDVAECITVDVLSEIIVESALLPRQHPEHDLLVHRLFNLSQCSAASRTMSLEIRPVAE